MTHFLRCCVWYLTATLVGLWCVLFILPVISANMLVDHVPARDPGFIQAYWIRSICVLIAAVPAAYFGFFMYENGRLRRATLALPFWAPLLYAVLYLALAYR